MTAEDSTNGGSRTVAVVAAFAEIVPYLKMYSFYISNFETALNVIGQVAPLPLHGAGERNHKYENAARLDLAASADPASQRRRLEQLLIEPVQRIPRYKLLLQELSRHTPPDHPSSAQLAECVAQIGVLADDVNERPRQREQRCRLLELHHSLGCVDFERHFAQLDGFTLAAAHRRVLRVCDVEEFDPVTGACGYTRPCAHQYVGKYQSCMV